MKYWILFLLVLVNVYSVEFEVIQETGDSRNRYDLVFIGDRYFEGEMQEYAEDVNYIWAALSKHYAFWNRYKNFFNVYRLDLQSSQINTEEIKDPINSAFGIDFLNGNFKGRAVKDWQKSLEFSSSMGVGNESTIILTNRYYTAGFAATNPRTGLIYSAPWASIVAHELGHIIAYAGDEYKVKLQSAHFNLFENFAKDENQAEERWGHWIGYKDNFTGYEINKPFKKEGSNFFIPSKSNGLMNNSGSGDLHAFNREKMILGMYEYINPIDAHTENNKTIKPNGILELKVVDQNVISVAWVVDNKIISEESVLRLSEFNFKDDTIVYGCAWDNTLNTDFKTNNRGGWVRRDIDSLLLQTVSWKISKNSNEYFDNEVPNFLNLVLGNTSQIKFFNEKDVITLKGGDEKKYDWYTQGNDVENYILPDNQYGYILPNLLKLISVEINSSGWVDAGFFGILLIYNNGWAYHINHGWIYIAEEFGDLSLWIWLESRKDWLWVNQESHPYFYSNNLKDWIYIN